MSDKLTILLGIAAGALLAAAALFVWWASTPEGREATVTWAGDEYGVTFA